MFNKTERPQAFKAAFGSFIGFLGSTFMKFITTMVFLGLFIQSHRILGRICLMSNSFNFDRSYSHNIFQVFIILT